VPFSRVLYIEQDDFREAPPPKYYRLAPGGKSGCARPNFVKCVDVVRMGRGKVVELPLHVRTPPLRGGDAQDGAQVKATLHWYPRPMPCRPKCDSTTPVHQENPDEADEGRGFLAT